jgi:uncharacterized hydrophobic protein (TIGR00341 family)
METRLIEALVPEDNALTIWQTPADDGAVTVHAIVPADAVGDLLNEIDSLLTTVERHRIIISHVQATLPAPPEPEEEKREEEEKPPEPPRIRRLFGSSPVSTQELVTSVHGISELKPVYFATVVLSSVVAAAGLMRDNTAVVIGAMVIAPLLGPNIALALSATLGDLKMGLRGAKSAAAGLAVAFAVAAITGSIADVDPTLPELSSRTSVDFTDIAIALASGAAGALAMTTGISATLIGVMVSVALLPPAVVTGLMAGSRNWKEAGDSATLLMVNVASVNLAAIAIFLAQGYRPANWWEKERAMRATVVAVALWLVILGALAAGIALLAD